MKSKSQKQIPPLRLTREEKRIARLLSKGYTHDAVALYFKEKGYTPSSKSSIEKQLKKLRDRVGAKNLFQLACILKDKELL